MSYQYILPMFYHEVAKGYVLEIYHEIMQLLPHCQLVNVGPCQLNVHQLHLSMVETRRLLHGHQDLKVNDHIALFYMSTGALQQDVVCNGWRFRALGHVLGEHKRTKAEAVCIAYKADLELWINAATGEMWAAGRSVIFRDIWMF
jgi:hypothetical protein